MRPGVSACAANMEATSSVRFSGVAKLSLLINRDAKARLAPTDYRDMSLRDGWSNTILTATYWPENTLKKAP